MNKAHQQRVIDKDLTPAIQQLLQNPGILDALRRARRIYNCAKTDKRKVWVIRAFANVIGQYVSLLPYLRHALEDVNDNDVDQARQTLFDEMNRFNEIEARCKLFIGDRFNKKARELAENSDILKDLRLIRAKLGSIL